MMTLGRRAAFAPCSQAGSAKEAATDATVRTLATCKKRRRANWASGDNMGEDDRGNR